MPINGIQNKSFAKGIAPLRIKTKNRDHHHYIKLLDASNKRQILTAFIRGGTDLSIRVPIGRYELKSAAGKSWYGDKYLFGPSTRYSKADKLFDFIISGKKVIGYTVELFLQPNGNLSMNEISPFDF